MSIQHRPLNGTDYIPAEVIEQILDNTKDDTQTLHACCFVCVGWHSYLIDSLYEVEPIRLRSKRQIYKLARASRIYPAVRGRLALARSVILEEVYRSASGFVHVFPLVLGRHLRKVKDLTFDDCFEQPLHPSFFVMLPQLKNVKHLHFSGTPPPSFASFQSIVRAFPQLEELDITALTQPSWNASQLTPPHVLNRPCISKLACVRVSDTQLEILRALVAWLSSSNVCSTIRRLELSLDSADSWETGPVNALLAYTASTLERLRMHILIARLGDPWGFPQFSHLRVLDIKISCIVIPISTEDVQRAFHSILASLTSPALEHVRLELRGSIATTLPIQDMDPIDATTDAYRAQYSNLHAVLARPIFSSLRRVTVVLSPTIYRDAKDVALKWLDFLRALFAPWCVRGIVNLACVADSISGFVDTIAADKGEGPHFIELRDRGYDLEAALQFVGLDPGLRWLG